MMQLEIGGERHPIVAGETVIGSAPDAAVVLAGDSIRPRHAILQGSAAGAAIRAASSEAEVHVNGVAVGTDPTPVLHGDKIRIGDHELLAVDPGRGGVTQLFDSGVFADLAPARPAGAPVSPPAANGRVVCLTDGREYKVRDALVFGRDAGSDVVVTGTDVSRTHAEIRRTDEGYVLSDSSANGTYVNGARLGEPRPLARADVIRIGTDEFRFYADPVPPPLETASTAATTAPNPRLAAAGPPLASLLVRSGPRKGDRHSVSAAAVTIGRGDENDVVIADPSVSAAHARLERREAIWSLADQGSTNGTFVDGEPVTEETPLGPGATLRFGDVSVLFEPLDDAPDAGRDAESAGQSEAPARARSVRPPRAQVPASGGIPTWLIVLVLAVLAAIAFLLLT